MYALRSASYLVASLLYLSLIPLESAFASDPPAKNSAAKFMGTASCASSNCHGSVAPRKTSNVLQNEYVTWQKHDRHSQAWLSLTTPEAKRMGVHLGMSTPEKEPECLQCHGTVSPLGAVPQPNPQQEPNIKVEDGVSCESCHGAAENYLSTHTARGTKHSDNLKNGMRPIVEPAQRAALCLDCHFSSENAWVSHRIYGAGHPRISFELDTFGMIQPRHWEVDADYIERKQNYDPIQTWFAGQLESASRILAQLKNPKRNKAGAMPELTNFYCYSCHHSLGEKQFKNREYAGQPGELRLNLAAFVILNSVTPLISANLGSRLNVEITGLHKAYSAGDSEHAMAQLDKSLAELKSISLAKDFKFPSSEKLLSALVTTGTDLNQGYFEVAEQIAMGMSAIISNDAGLSRKYQRDLDTIYRALKSPNEFNATEFSAAAKNLKARI